MPRERLPCYFCGAPSTSEDHCPPRVFFPETKDVGADGPNFRENLLKLDSCKAHNEDYSLDDEYTAFAIAHLVENNGVAEKQVITKVLRAIGKRPRLVRSLYPSPKVVQVEGGETMAFSLNLDRVDRVMDRVARGLYFHHTGTPMQGPRIRWKYPGLRSEETLQTEPELVALARRATELVDSGEVPLVREHRGHPTVFRYEIIGRPAQCMFRLTFYDGFVALGALPSHVPPAVSAERP